MMKLDALLTQLYVDLLTAQQNAYDYSEKLLKESHNSLFSAPMLQVDEVNVKIPYIVKTGLLKREKVLDQARFASFHTSLIKNRITSFFAKVCNDNQQNKELIKSLKEQEEKALKNISTNTTIMDSWITADFLVDEAAYEESYPFAHLMDDTIISQLPESAQKEYKKTYKILLNQHISKIKEAISTYIIVREVVNQEVIVDGDQLNEVQANRIQELELKIKMDELENFTNS